MELKITKEKVLEAASKCSTAKATLETLFPECFEKYDNSFVEKLGDLINREMDFDVFNNIPGDLSIDKAKHIYYLITNLKK